MSDRPNSVTRAIRLHWALLAVGLVTAVLTRVLRDDLIRSWAEGRPDMRRVLATQGLQAIKDGAVRPPAYVPVAVVLFIVFALLVWMLLIFFSNGYNWARVSLAALLFFAAVATVAGIRTGPPVTFVVLSVLSLILEVAAMVYLWHRDTNRFLRHS
ncbi:hypothetical protein [Nocardioides sp.]|uniref:hypothetical protein n=1 Tax=Nocardioides sp. TaxID=35761 RepID=UPI00356795E3